MERALIIDIPREEIGTFLNGGDDSRLRSVDRSNALEAPLGLGLLRIGHWGERKFNPLPDFIIVRDDEMTDTVAWLSAFLPNLAPFTAWCRLLSTASALRLERREQDARAIVPLSAWVGAILAETSLSLNRGMALKDVTGLRALSSSTFSAARASYVWNHEASLDEVAVRHEESIRRLGLASRGLEHRRLMPLWRLLNGTEVLSKVRGEDAATTPFRAIFRRRKAISSVEPESIVSVVEPVASYFDLPELTLCATGPQSGRVTALDRIARKMGAGPQSPAIDMILGFAASLVDPGVAVLPELLRRYSDLSPSAPVWTGAFAGVWAPLRVLTENGGLGRLIAKEVTKPTDLFARPAADIAFNDLGKWIGSGDTASQLRTGSNFSILVELIDGVSAPFPYSHESKIDVRSAQNVQRTFDLQPSTSQSSRVEATVGQDRSMRSALATIADLTARMNDVEQQIADLVARPTRQTRTTKK